MAPPRLARANFKRAGRKLFEKTLDKLTIMCYNNNSERKVINMKELLTMTTQELRDHIKECEEMLKKKDKERFDCLLGNVVMAAQKLLNEYPNTSLVVETYCEGCEQKVEVEIGIDDLAYINNYVK